MTQPAIASFGDFATLNGFKASYVTQLRKDGRLVLSEDGKAVRVAESLARIEATRDPSKAAVAARHAATRAVGAGQGAAGAAGTAPAPVDSTDEPDEDDPGAPAKPDSYQDWRRRSEKAKALGLERENALAEGRLLDAGEVAAVVAAAVTTLRSRLESLPPILGPQLAAETDEHRATALIAESIEMALEEISREFADLAKRQP